MGTADISFGFRYMPKGYTLGVTFPFIIGAPDVVTGTKVYDDIWKKFPKLMSKEWRQVKILWLTSSMPQSICTNAPVRRLEDMKGLQLRVPSKELGDLMKDLGATPVFMSTADYTVALEKGTVDGGTTQPSAIHENKLAGRINYLVDVGLGTPTPVFAIMNKDTYNELPKDLQKVIDQNKDYGKQMTLDLWINAMDKAKKYFAENGVEMVSLSDKERARWTPIVDNARARVGADLDKKGLPGTEIVNFIKERVEYYTK
jgi:TRAP-type C4-dicarboxylate transport system substrate-binding protein